MGNIFLPVVKPEIACPLQKDMREKNYLKKQLKRLKKENPIILKWIRDYSKQYRNKKNMAYCALMVYRLLESQAEADCMNAEII